MPIPRTVQIFTAKATNGVGIKCRTVERGGIILTEPIDIQVAGTWKTGVTVEPQISLDGGTTFTNAQKLKDDGTFVDIVLTADGTFNLSIASDVEFTLIVAGVGAPPPSLNAWAHGNIVSLA